MEKLLHNIHRTEHELPIVNKGTRFELHLIDAIIMFVLFLIYVFSMEKIFGVIQEGDFIRPSGGLLLYFIYYIGFEFAFSKTPGKFIKKTKVVDKNGNKPKLIQLIIRNASRLIPFDDISYLLDKRGWHDQLSGTYVIKEEYDVPVP